MLLYLALFECIQAQNIVPPSTKIAGLGWALFTTVVLTIILTCLCLLLSQHEYAGYQKFISDISMLDLLSF
jgi:hypothetical protein